MSNAFRLGLFIIVALALFFTGVFWIGKKQFLFEPTFTLAADFTNVAGLFEGSVVRVGGTKQGTVKRVELPPKPDQKVHVLMELTERTKSVLREDSVASISSEGLVGDKYVEISFGTIEAKPISNGATIDTRPPLQISDIIDNTNRVLESAKSSLSNIEETTENFKMISVKINQGSGTAGAFINDKSLYRDLSAGVTSMKEDMEALKHNFLLRGFFKDRGYTDSSELTRNQVERLPAKPPTRKFTFEAERLFDKPTTAKLKNEKTLNDAGHFLESNDFGIAVVAASADLKGDSEKDRTLTQARAAVVRQYLVNNFKIKDDSRIRTIGLGESKHGNQRDQLEILVFGR